MNWLVAARVVQGLGGGGILTLASVIISDITTLSERPKFLAIVAFAWALGTNIGVCLIRVHNHVANVAIGPSWRSYRRI
jgi:MFS family permease